jgi:transcription elongation factor GreA
VSQKEVILTPEGLKKLQDEIEYLSTIKREEVADRIKQAREFGDISENSEYDDAKNEQSMLEGRINTLEEKLRKARVVKAPEGPADHVEIGQAVTLKDLGRDRVVECTLVGSAEADPANRMFSNESPVGQAILGKRVGDVVTVPAPAGPIRYEIMAIGAR